MSWEALLRLIPIADEGDHDIADLLLCLDVPVRIDDFVERVGAVDDRREQP